MDGDAGVELRERRRCELEGDREGVEKRKM